LPPSEPMLMLGYSDMDGEFEILRKFIGQQDNEKQIEELEFDELFIPMPKDMDYEILVWGTWFFLAIELIYRNYLDRIWYIDWYILTDI